MLSTIYNCPRASLYKLACRPVQGHDTELSTQLIRRWTLAANVFAAYAACGRDHSKLGDVDAEASNKTEA